MSGSVTVDFQTLDGSATADADDFAPVAGTITWSAGDNLPKLIQVPVRGDSAFEADELFMLQLTNPSPMIAIRKDLGIGTIANDDPLHYVAPAQDGAPNELELLVEESYLALYRNGEVVLDGQFSAPFPITIVGASDVDNRLTVELASFNSALTGGLAFHGGSFADSLTIVDDTATAIVHHVAGPDSGALVVDGATMSYTGVEWVTDRWAPIWTGLPDTSPEGSALTLYGWVADPSFAEACTFQWTITKDSLPFGEATGANFTFVPDDNGVYVVSLTAAVADSGSGTTTRTVTVTNIPPTIDAGADRDVQEGAEVVFGGSLNDAGTNDSHTIRWDFGDGSTAEGSLTPAHVYADNSNSAMNAVLSAGVARRTLSTEDLNVADDGGGTAALRAPLAVGRAARVDAALAFDFGRRTAAAVNVGLASVRRFDQKTQTTSMDRACHGIDSCGYDASDGPRWSANACNMLPTDRQERVSSAQQAAVIDAVFGSAEEDFLAQIPLPDSKWRSAPGLEHEPEVDRGKRS